MTVRTDRWLAGGLLAVAGLEVWLRDDLPRRPAALVFIALIAGTLTLRQNRPLLAVGLGFGAALLTTVVDYVFALPEMAPVSAAAILLLPYSLARRGSLREVVWGGALVAATWLSTLLTGQVRTLPDAIGSAVVLLFPGAIGGVVRFRADAQARAVGQARLLEREQLARELHDSVAHHLVAITLQTQAARAVLATRPEDAKTALSAIEDESRRTLAELRALVGALRDDGAAVTHTGRLCDVPGLAARTTRPTVEVELAGDLDGLSPTLERAVFRLAQESITNAVKHARNATRVRLRIAAEGRSIVLQARDDGERSGLPRGSGFGLVGMAERVALVGGTFEAGPLADGGWLVAAVLPRDGGAR